MIEIRKILEQYAEHLVNRKISALASVVDVEGSSYRRIGARILVFEDGTWIGGINGGCMEGDALLKAQLAIHTSQPAVVRYDTMNEDSIEIGLGFNGLINDLFNPNDAQDANNEVAILNKIIDTKQPCISIRIMKVHQANCRLVKFI